MYQPVDFFINRLLFGINRLIPNNNLLIKGNNGLIYFHQQLIQCQSVDKNISTSPNMITLTALFITSKFYFNISFPCIYFPTFNSFIKIASLLVFLTPFFDVFGYLNILLFAYNFRIHLSKFIVSFIKCRLAFPLHNKKNGNYGKIYGSSINHNIHLKPYILLSSAPGLSLVMS